MSNVSNQTAFQSMHSLVGQVVAAKLPTNTILYTKPTNGRSLAQAQLASLKAKF